MPSACVCLLVFITILYGHRSQGAHAEHALGGLVGAGASAGSESRAEETTAASEASTSAYPPIRDMILVHDTIRAELRLFAAAVAQVLSSCPLPPRRNSARVSFSLSLSLAYLPPTKRRKSCELSRLGVSGGRAHTRPLRDARRFPSTRWYLVPGAMRTTLGFGICPSFKGRFLSPRVPNPYVFDSHVPRSWWRAGGRRRWCARCTSTRRSCPPCAAATPSARR
jgi:hypothetical protein